MAPSPILIAYHESGWQISQGGQHLGSFHVRATALRVAIQATHWLMTSDRQSDVFIHDRSGAVYTAWKAGRDALYLDAN
jgi:hypothetical protein